MGRKVLAGVAGIAAPDTILPFCDGRSPMTAPWPEDLEHFLETVEWTFAKTYAKTWPHEYIVSDQVDLELFMKTVRHIRENGVLKPFYECQFTYFEQDGLVYWTMVPPEGSPEWYPVEEETIINRCRVEGTYEYRLANGTLP